MKYNAECTLWHKSGSSYITLHYDCWWQDNEAENISKSDCTDVDTAKMHLPLGANIAKGDYIAKGNVDYEITGSVTDLLSRYKPLKVSTISSKDYGSTALQHIEVTAR